MLQVSVRSRNPLRMHEQIVCEEIAFYDQRCMLENVETDFAIEINGLEIISHYASAVSYLINIKDLCNIKTM